MNMPTDRPTITPDLIARFAAYYRNNPTWGALHIILDDGNYETPHVAWCVDYAFSQVDVEGYLLAQILVQMSVTQRRKIGRKAEQQQQQQQVAT